MYIITFELNKAKLESNTSENLNQKYETIRQLLHDYNFRRINDITYVNPGSNLSYLFDAISELKNIDWFNQDIIKFLYYKVDDYQDFTDSIKRSN